MFGNLGVYCIRVKCLLFSATFLVPSALQAQGESTKYRVRKFLLHDFFYSVNKEAYDNIRKFYRRGEDNIF